MKLHAVGTKNHEQQYSDLIFNIFLALFWVKTMNINYYYYYLLFLFYYLCTEVVKINAFVMY